MKYHLLKYVGFFSILLSLPAIAAEDFGYKCTHTQVNQERHIHVAYLDGDNVLPCEVRYYKGNQMRVLWSATNTQGYCEAKAEAFAEKQAHWGWKCDSVIYQE